MNQIDPCISAPRIYSRFPGDADRVYGALCAALAGRVVDWAAFTEADWKLFCRMAEPDNEGVGPALHWTFRHGHWPAEMPAAVRQSLGRMYYNTAAHNTLLFLEMTRICAAIGARSIPIVPLKGAELARTAYPDSGLRPMGDLDLLIPAAQVRQAVDAVHALGYEEAEEEIWQGINETMAYNAFLIGGPDRRIGLELHWNLVAPKADNRYLPAEWAWEGVAAGRNGVGTLDPTRHLLYLIVHLIERHGGFQERLIWFYDLDCLVRTRQIDWPSFEADAVRLAVGGPARYALEAVRERFGTPVPDSFPERLCVGEAWLAFHKARMNTLKLGSRTTRTLRDLRHLAWPARVRLVLALLFPAPAFMRWRYRAETPGRLAWSYLQRWWDILKDAARTVIPASEEAVLEKKERPAG